MQKVFKFLYDLFLISFYFWLYLWRGLVVYSLIASAAALFKTSQQFFLEGKEEEIGTLFKHNYQRFSGYPLLSFFSVFSMILLYSCLYFANRSEHVFSLALVVMIVYGLALISVNITLFVYFIVNGMRDSKQALAWAFVSSVKHPIHSLYLLFVLFLLVVLLKWNLLAFVVLAPCVYGCAVITSFHKFPIQMTENSV